MSEGNVNDLSTGLKAIDLVPEVAAVGEEVVTEAPTLKNVPISRDNLLLTHWCRQFMPTGWEVVVNLPFLPDSKSSIFLIKCSPEILPIVPCDRNWWIAQKNYFQFIRHDIHAHVGVDNTAVGLCPPGIFINQITDPSPLSYLTLSHRFWQGKLNFHIRVIGNFNQAGYIRTTKLRNVAIPFGIYDRYKYCPIPQKLGTSAQSGYFNSYARADVTMFRHQEMTIPYEQITPIDMLNRRKALFDGISAYDNFFDPNNEGWGDSDPDKTNIIVPNHEDYIAVEAVGALAASQQDAQLRFVIEMAAGDDFQLFSPLPISNVFFDAQSRYFSQDGDVRYGAVHDSKLKIPDIVPDTTLTSDGQSTVNDIE